MSKEATARHFQGVRLRIAEFIHRMWSRRYCWASLVIWALYGYPVERATKCGYCYACMTRAEIEKDIRNFTEGPEK